MRKKFKTATRIVIKVGTSTLTHENGKMNFKKLDNLARVLTDLIHQDREVILVTSGAIGAGMERLNIDNRPESVAKKQAIASVGQNVLMQMYSKSLSEYNQTAGQILFTKDVCTNNIKRNNIQNTIETLLQMNVLPIINENDSVVTDELEEELFGQNDLLSAMVAELVEADLLIILSDVEGLYDKDPNINENAKLIKLITKIDDEIIKGAEGTVTNVGTGGMKTKVQAAKYAMDHGIETIFAAGNDMRVLYQILEGEDIGTFFCVINQDNNIKCK